MTCAIRTAIILQCFLLAACSSDESKPKSGNQPPPIPTALPPIITPDMTPLQVADKLWEKRCITCHGPHGKGDGYVAESITDKPTDFTNPTWQASVDDDRIRKVILEGGKAIEKSKQMKPNPELKGQDKAMDILVSRVRAFRPKKADGDAGAKPEKAKPDK